MITKEIYCEKYLMMTETEYKKLKKAELIHIIVEFTEALKNCDIEYCTPYGDSYTWQHEFARWFELHFKKNYSVFYGDVVENDSRMMYRKKDWLVDYIIVLDLTFSSMYECMHKHRYHDCLENLRNMLSGRNKKRRG